MATKTTKSTKNKTPTNKKQKVDQKESVNFQIHETIQTFVLNLKQDDEQTRPFKSLLLPFIAAIVLVGISVSTSAILPAGIIGAAFGELILKKIFESLGTNILWDIIQATKKLGNNQQPIDVILQNHQLIEALNEKLKTDMQFQSDIGKMLYTVKALSTFTDKAREEKYEEIIQELCGELKLRHEILNTNKDDLKVSLTKNWDDVPAGYVVLEETVKYAEKIEASKGENDQDSVKKMIRSRSLYIRITERLRSFSLPARVLLWMLSWIASILIAVWLLHLLASYSSSWCNCDQFSLLPILTSTPTAMSTATIIPTTTLAATAAFTITPSMTSTATITPTATATKIPFQFRLKEETSLYQAPNSQGKSGGSFSPKDDGLVISYLGCAYSGNQLWLHVSFSRKLPGGTREGYDGWIPWQVLLDSKPTVCSSPTPGN